MPRIIQAPNGRQFQFPDDATDQEVQEFFDGQDQRTLVADSNKLAQARDVGGRAVGGLMGTLVGGAADMLDPDQAPQAVLPMSERDRDLVARSGERGIGDVLPTLAAQGKNAINRGFEFGANSLAALGRGAEWIGDKVEGVTADGMGDGFQYAGKLLQEPGKGVQEVRAAEESYRRDAGLPTLQERTDETFSAALAKEANEQGKAVTDYWTSDESRANQTEFNREYAKEGATPILKFMLSNPATAADVIAPSLIEAMAPAGAAGRAVRAERLGVAMAAGDSAAARVAAEGGDALAQVAARSEAMAAGVTKATEAAGMASASASAAYSAEQQSQQTREQILTAPVEVLAQYPGFNALADRMGEQAAREAIAQQAGDGALTATAMINAITYIGSQRAGLNVIDSRLAGAAPTSAGRVATMEGARGRLARGAEGLAKESASEGLQGAGEQMGQNLGMSAADSRVGLMSDVGKSAAIEALAGGPIGGLSGLATAPRVDTSAGPAPVQQVTAAAAATPDAAAGAATVDAALQAAGVDLTATTPGSEADAQLDALLQPFAPEVIGAPAPAPEAPQPLATAATPGPAPVAPGVELAPAIAADSAPSDLAQIGEAIDTRISELEATSAQRLDPAQMKAAQKEAGQLRQKLAHEERMERDGVVRADPSAALTPEQRLTMTERMAELGQTIERGKGASRAATQLADLRKRLDGVDTDGQLVALAKSLGIEPAAARATETAPAATEVAPAATESAEPAAAEPVTMQNRDRSRASSVAQMQGIRKNPEAERLSYSRDANTGAPMVSEGVAIPDGDRGRTDVVVMGGGRRVPVTYAVVDAARVHASHTADGTRNPDYDRAALRALNNGRTAGLQAAFADGNASQYVDGMKADAELLGLQPSAFEGKRQPMVVRLYAPDQNTGDMGAESNASSQLGLSPVEQAQTDARALPDLGSIQWSEDGSISPGNNANFFRAFFASIGDTQAATLTDAKGTPNAQAMQRVRAAIVERAYGDQRLLTALLEDVNPDNRNVMNALVQAAPAFAAADQSGKLSKDLRAALVGGLEMIRDTQARGLSLSDAIAQGDLLGRSPDVDAMAQFMAANIRSPKRMGQAFTAMATFADQQQMRDNTLDIFGNTTTATVADAMGAATNEEGTNEQSTADAKPSDAAPAAAGRKRREPGKDRRAAAKDAADPEAVRESVAAGDLDFGDRSDAELEAEYAQLEDTDGGRIIDVDQARELSPEYRADRTLSPKIHAAASALAKGMYARALAKPVAPGRSPTVLFTAGGGGSGKSTATKRAIGDLNDDIVMDGTLSNLDRAVGYIDDALASGRSVRVAYVYRSPVKSVEGAINRAIRIRRPVPVEVMAEAHAKSPRVVEALNLRYYNDDRVEIIGIFNDGNPDEVQLFNVADGVPNVDQTETESLFREHAERARDDGRMDAALARGFGIPEMGKKAGQRTEDAAARGTERTPDRGADQQVTSSEGAAAAVAEDLRQILAKSDAPASIRVGVVNSASELPASIRAAIGPSTDGVYSLADQRVYIVSDNLPQQGRADRAAWILWHELAGHHGLHTLLGEGLDAELQRADKNPTVAKIADTIARERGIDPGNRELAVEEALSELAAGLRANDPAEFSRRWNMDLPGKDQRPGVLAAIERFIKRVKAAIAKVMGRSPYSDSQVRELLENAYNAAMDRDTEAAPDMATEGVRQSARRSTGQTDTPAFKRWFGGSKVVDGNGKPLVVYHGTRREFDVFAPSKPRNAFGNPVGIYFTDDKREAEQFAEDVDGATDERSRVIPAYVSIRSPYVVERGERLTSKDADRIASSGEYDGIIRRRRDGTTEYIAFAPEQIKSATANNGEFNPASGNIRESTRRTPADARKERRKRILGLGQSGAATLTPASLSAAGRSWTATAKTKKQAALTETRRLLQDRMITVRDAIGDIEAQIGGPIDELADVYREENLMHGKAADGVQRVNETLVEPLKDQIKKSGISTAAIEKFLWAQHAIERNARIATINPGMKDGGAGMSTADAQAHLSSITAVDRSKLAAISKAVQALRNDTLTTLLTSGQITKGEHTALAGMYQSYVPLRGKKGEEGEGRVGAGKGIDMRGKPVRRALGRNSEPDNILGEVVGDAYRAQVQAAKATVGRSLLRAALQYPNPDFWQVEPVTVEQRYSEATGEVYLGVANDQNEEDIVIVKHMGKPYRVRLVDADLRNAMKNLGVEGFEGVAKYLGWVNRWLSAVFTRYNPAFIPVNMIRDAIQGSIGVGSELGIKALGEVATLYPQAAAGMYAEARGNRGDASVPNAQKSMADWAREFYESGASTGYATFADSAQLQQQIEAEMADLLDLAKSGKPLAAVGEAVRRTKMAQTVESANEIIENAMRLSVYVRQRRQGDSRSKAATYAKNLTVNFNRKGAGSSVGNALFLFFNASMQGTHRTLQLLRDPKVMATLGGIGTLQFTLAMTMGAAKYEDEEETLWEKIPDHVRQKALVIPTGYSDTGDAEYIAIPMPFGFNLFTYIGGYPALMASDTWRSRNDAKRKPVSDIARAGIDAMSVVPVGEDGWYFPTVMRIFSNLQANKDDLGRRIRNEGFGGDEMPRSSMGKADTPALYKTIATALNRVGGGDDYTKPVTNLLDYAPEDIEYLLGTFGGGPANVVQQTWRLGERQGADLAVNAGDIPVVSRVVGATRKASVDSRLYYETADKYGTGIKRIRDAYAKGGVEEFYRVRDELGSQFDGVMLDTYKTSSRTAGYRAGQVKTNSAGIPDIAAAPGSAYAVFKDADKAVKGFNQAIRLSYNDSNIDRLQRRQIIDGLQGDRSEAMRQALAYWNYSAAQGQ